MPPFAGPFRPRCERRGTYPEDARRRGISGIVVVEVMIGRDGVGGKPVPVIATHTVPFKL